MQFAQENTLKSELYLKIWSLLTHSALWNWHVRVIVVSTQWCRFVVYYISCRCYFFAQLANSGTQWSLETIFPLLAGMSIVCNHCFWKDNTTVRSKRWQESERALILTMTYESERRPKENIKALINWNVWVRNNIIIERGMGKCLRLVFNMAY